MSKPFLDVLKGKRSDPPPIWLMRQAGRYLPEYRKLRAEAGGFLNLCYTPEFAVEVTLQPVIRYSFDAAILFSDILVVPDGLGQDVSFVEGTGPVLKPVRSAQEISLLSTDRFLETLAPVYEAVSRLTGRLDANTALVGFAGAPWTVACYMVEGSTSRDFNAVKSFCYGNPKEFAQLMDLLVEATILHLSAQVEAGVDAVQIFESHAGVLPEIEFMTWVVEPIRQIVSALRRKWPDLPIIGFPRGAGPMYVTFAEKTGVTAVSLDTTVSLSWAMKVLPTDMPVQGNIDPVYLLSGGEEMYQAIERTIEACQGRPHIFNLGHGVDKHTNPETVQRLVSRVREFSS
jgi:uroporphyrinogen decarboxylase